MSIMKNMIDIGDFVDVLTEQRVLCDLVNRVKERRKEAKLSQRALAERTGVSYASIRRFEATGEIAFRSLLSIARVLDALADFETLFSNEIITSLKDY